jgi:aminopeptidase
VTDPRLARYATLICDYSLELQAGQRLLVLAPPDAGPLVLAIGREAWRRGARPTVMMEPPAAEERLVREGSERQLRHVDPVLLGVIEIADAVVSVLAPHNSRALASLPPARSSLRTAGRSPLTAVTRERFLAGGRSWLVCAFPTPAAAQDAGMGTAAFERFVYAGCLLDEADPAAEWRAIAARQERLVERLSGSRELRIRGPGTDLILGVEGCTWEGSSGRSNLPDGEVYTSPTAPAANGEVRFTLPFQRYGRRFEGVRLRFRDGVVVDAGAAVGEEALVALLDTDEGARRIGEVAIGTNVWIQHPTGFALFDEKMGGTFHIALGTGFPELGGTNVSAIHWDIVGDLREGGTLEADGGPIVHDGRLAV